MSIIKQPLLHEDLLHDCATFFPWHKLFTVVITYFLTFCQYYEQEERE